MRHLLNKKIELIYEDYCIDEIVEIAMMPLESSFITHDTNQESYDFEQESAEVPVCGKDVHVIEHNMRNPRSFDVRTGVIEASERFNANVDIWRGFDNKKTKIKLKRRLQYATEETIKARAGPEGFVRDHLGNILPTENDHL